MLLALAEKSKDPELKKLVEERKVLRTTIAGTLEATAPRAPSALEQLLERTNDACKAAGAQLLVVALPLDVMVSKDEWKKYGKEPIDLTVTQVLLDDIVRRSEAVGARGLDPTEALRKAEPGAFLDGDLHLTPKGHRALAEAIHAALDAPPKPKSELTLPKGRSWPPTEDEWRAVDEVNVKGSTAANCETRQVREWFRMTCRDRYPDFDEVVGGTATDSTRQLQIASIELLEGGHGDVLFTGFYGQLTVTLPVLEGDAARLSVAWHNHTRELTLEHPAAGPPKRAFGPIVEKAPRERPGFVNRDERREKCPRNVCTIDWSNPLREVKCENGERPSGAWRRCARPCDTAAACGKGTCIPWPTGNYCQP